MKSFNLPYTQVKFINPERFANNSFIPSVMDSTRANREEEGEAACGVGRNCRNSSDCRDSDILFDSFRDFLRFLLLFLPPGRGRGPVLLVLGTERERSLPAHSPEPKSSQRLHEFTVRHECSRLEAHGDRGKWGDSTRVRDSSRGTVCRHRGVSSSGSSNHWDSSADELRVGYLHGSVQLSHRRITQSMDLPIEAYTPTSV
jgi:hypothetical protein